MPIYEYACTGCGRRLEVIHGIHETGPSECDACGGVMTKLLSPPAIVFRGTGWAKKERVRSRAGDSDGRAEEKPAGQAREQGPAGAGAGSGGGGEQGTSASGAGEGGGTAGTSTSGGRGKSADSGGGGSSSER